RTRSVVRAMAIINRRVVHARRIVVRIRSHRGRAEEGAGQAEPDSPARVITAVPVTVTVTVVPAVVTAIIVAAAVMTATAVVPAAAVVAAAAIVTATAAVMTATATAVVAAGMSRRRTKGHGQNCRCYDSH